MYSKQVSDLQTELLQAKSEEKQAKAKYDEMLISYNGFQDILRGRRQEPQVSEVEATTGRVAEESERRKKKKKKTKSKK